MLIDWFTVIAQVVNFLILVWLLKRFLYRPILNAIDARERRIAAELSEADAKKAEALKEREVFQQKNLAFDKQREMRMKQVIEEAKTERQEMFDTARREADELRAKLQSALKSERRSLNEALSQRVREEVFAIARKVLSDLADTTLEQRITELFLRRLRTLQEAESSDVKSAFVKSSDPLLLRTAFDLPAEQYNAIERLVKEMFGGEKQIEFKLTPELVSGIEMSADGHKIAWSIDDYLLSLAKSVDSLLKTESERNINLDTDLDADVNSAVEVDAQSGSVQKTNVPASNVQANNKAADDNVG